MGIEPASVGSMPLFFIIEMRLLSIVLGAAIVLSATCCQKNAPSTPSSIPDGLTAVNYEFDGELFVNPERGMYSGTGISSETANPISANSMKALRADKRSLYMLEFWLKDFYESDISEGYLELIRKNLQVLRESGVKTILRFGYTENQGSSMYDATEEQVLRHIAQLKPILQEYYDVIYVLQAGFVGCWGEWYYTTHFVQNPSKTEDYLPRKHVCDALLDALPGERQIELRTPTFKMKMYGYSLADTITRAEAHKPTTKARLAGHNDCYLASANDQGTFNGNTGREYWKAETKYTIMGGETCALAKQFCKCDNTLQDMEAQHFSYLNMSYNKSVLNYWKSEGCYDEIRLRLGYRLFLTECGFTQNPKAGEAFRVVMNITNDGFASIMNPRDVEFVLTDKNGKVAKTYKIDSDPRYWMPGTTTVIDQNLALPAGISGEYTLWLNLPDPCETLRSNPLFSIRLANKDVWDEAKGMNKIYTIKF